MMNVELVNHVADHLCSCAVLTIEVMIFIISLISLKFLFKSCFVKLLLSNNSNQYLVSRASFEAILIFAIKSALLIPASASTMLAPILVPDLSNCFEIINSFSSIRDLYSCIIASEKLNVLVLIKFSFIFITIQNSQSSSIPPHTHSVSFIIQPSTFIINLIFPLQGTFFDDVEEPAKEKTYKHQYC